MNRAAWRAAAPWLALTVLAWLVVFRDEVAAAVSVWRASTAYGHCFFVLPLALWLGWERRATIAAATPRLCPAAVVAVVPGAVAWLVAERLGLMEGRQLAAMAMLDAVLLLLLGPAAWRRLAVPLLFLFFLVPFGAFLVPSLQAFTAWSIGAGLDVLAVPHAVDGLLVEIPSGAFRVEEACAGLRFLVASFAFGVLYACTMYRDAGRRAAFVAASVAVPILANGLRALGIVLLGHWLGSPRAASVDHLVYGWVFFAGVTALLVAAGLPFRQPLHLPTRVRTAAATSSPASTIAPSEPRGAISIQTSLASARARLRL